MTELMHGFDTFDHQVCNTSDCEYRLIERKIYSHSLTPENPRRFVNGELVSDPHALQWTLFEDLGIPYGKDKQSLLAKDEYIVEIRVACGAIAALSNLDHIYLYKPMMLPRPMHWHKMLGRPQHLAEDQLTLPRDRRAWTFSCSVRPKAKRRTDFINPRDMDVYFSDGYGIHFDFGFTATIYVLLGDGQRIVYWDTGLPPSFSRGFLVPEGMQGQSICAAGSTIFLSAIDVTSCLPRELRETKEPRDLRPVLHFFTRMIDFEIGGACPGLRVSYVDFPQVSSPDGSFPLGVGTRKMPLPGWLEHTTDAIHTHLTSKVVIRVTGQGNAARELRILAHHPQHGGGFYFKTIYGSHWTFCIAPVTHAPQILYPFDRSLLSPFKNYNLIRSGTIPFSVNLELLRFHPFLSDSDYCWLRCTQSDFPSPIFDLRLHVVDAWGLHYHNEGDEDLIGNVEGEPKALMATLVFEDKHIEFVKRNRSPFTHYIEQYFLPYHGKTRAIRILGDNSTVVLNFEDKHELHFQRTVTAEETRRSFFIKKVMNPKLLARPSTKEQCALLIAQNQKALQQLEDILKSRRKDDRKFAVFNTLGHALRPLAAGYYTLFPSHEPKIRPAIHDAEPLLKLHRQATLAAGFRKTLPPGYIQANGIVTRRIQALRALQF